MRGTGVWFGGMAAASRVGSTALAAPPAGPQDGQWTMSAGDYASTRFSPLDQLTTANVSQLRPEFTFSLGVDRGEEAAPLVVGSTMNLVTAYPNYVYALDLSKPGAPQKWKFEPKPEAASQGVACCDVVNRGAAYADGKVFFNTLDNHTIALDAATGKMLWNTKLGDINKGETMTMAPLVVKGKVLVGDSGGEFGVLGWLQALDAKTGKVAWKAYHPGPDADVLIGPDFKPAYPMDRGKDLGVSTWPPYTWKMGGGTAWGWISYDPALNLIYYGTSNPGPWNADDRPGDNKWSSGVFARDPDTGAAKWFYQLNPHDLHDYDAVNETILIDVPVNGVMKKVAARIERNGYVYLLDRATGQVLSADPYGYVNASNGVGLKTGQLRVDLEEA